MRAHFVRHGQSASNAAPGRVSLPAERGDRLTELGRRQILEAAPHLSGLGATRVLAGPLRRAQESAELLAGELGLPVVTDEQLTEFRDSEGYGALEPEEQRDNRWSVWMAANAENPDHSHRGAESFNQIVARAERVKRSLAEGPDENALLIGHGILTRFVFFTSLLGDRFEPSMVPRMWQLEAVNAGLTVFEHGEPDEETGPAPGRWRCLTWMARPWDPPPPRGRPAPG